MPVTEMTTYLVRFKLADGEHVACAHAIKAHNDAERAHVTREIVRAMNATSVEYPQGNPDFAIIEISEAGHPEVAAAAAKLQADPNRIGAEQLGLDTPNRILTDPSITQRLAADQVPG
jgi:hypothetical protein